MSTPSGPVRCFFLTPTDRCRLRLRVWMRDCDPPACWHDTSVTLPEVEPHATTTTTIGADDPRWPTRCGACGAALHADDPRVMRQVLEERVYRRSDDGPDCTLHDAPVGAMWWSESEHDHVGPDGRCLVVRTPGGDWCPDCPSTQGRPWTRSGTVPHVTAHPSILFPGRYHGWLTEGVLSPC